MVESLNILDVLKVFGFMLLFVAAIGCGVMIRTSQRQSAMEGYCRQTYGASYRVSSWTHGNTSGDYNISCMTVTSSATVRLEY